MELCWGVCSIAWRILVLRTEELELECPWPFRLANISPISRWWKAKDFNSTSNWNARETLDHDLMLHRIKLINHWKKKSVKWDTPFCYCWCLHRILPYVLGSAVSSKSAQLKANFLEEEEEEYRPSEKEIDSSYLDPLGKSRVKCKRVFVNIVKPLEFWLKFWP